MPGRESVGVRKPCPSGGLRSDDDPAPSGRFGPGERPAAAPPRAAGTYGAGRGRLRTAPAVSASSCLEPDRDRVEASRYVVTLLGPRVEGRHVERVRDVLAGLGLRVERVAPLSGRSPEEPSEAEVEGERCRALELAAGGAMPDAGRLRGAIRSAFEEERVDASVQRDDRWRRRRRLACLDMDSTLIDVEVIDELARAAGAEREVAAITDAAMRGEIEFRGALRARLERVAGLPVEEMEAVARRLPLAPGAGRLLAALDRHGWRIAVVSGGFGWFVRRVAERFGFRFDHVHAHELVLRNGRLTGEIEGEVIDGAGKAAFVRGVAAREGLSREQVVAAGDGANDLRMLREAGLGVAFRPRPILRAGADHVIENFGLDGILYLLGMNDRDVDGA